GRAWRKRFVEEALTHQVIEPHLLPFGILKSVRDLIFELPVLVEDQGSSAKDPDAAPRINSLRRNEAELLLQLVGLKRQDLNVFGHGFMQHKTVGTDPDRRTNRLDLDVAVGVDFELLAILPYEAEPLLRLVQHRIVGAPAVDQLLIAPLPCAVDIGFARLLNAIIVEIFEQRLAIAVLLIVRYDFAVDGEKGGYVIGEGQVSRRTIVEGANRHRQEMTGDPSALIPDDASVFFSGCHRTDFRKPCQPYIECRIQESGHQQLTPAMGLAEFRVQLS